MKGYSREVEQKTTAKALGKELNISRKHAVEICNHLRNRYLNEAIQILEDTIEKKRAIPFRKYSGSTGHRKGKMGPGRYPIKAAGEILHTLRNAEANAEFKGMNPNDLFVWHIAASKGRTFESYFPRARGRTTPKRRESVNLEIILKLKE